MVGVIGMVMDASQKSDPDEKGIVTRKLEGGARAREASRSRAVRECNRGNQL